MKKPAAYLLLTIFLLTGYACSTDLELLADYKEETVVYGVLNSIDNTHYIRIQKAYLGEGNALEMAEVADSIYYDEGVLSVVVQQIDPGSGNVEQEFQLERIDGNTIGLIKEDNIFAHSPNWLYRFSATLDQAKTYKLIINNLETGKEITAETPVVDDFDVSRPFPSFDVNFALGAEQPKDTEVQFTWRRAEDGAVYDGIFRFYYWEWTVQNPADRHLDSVDLVMFTNKTATVPTPTVKSTGAEFYNRLLNAVEPPGTNEGVTYRRTVDTTKGPLTYIMHAGAEELYNYIRVGRAQSGLTTASIQPVYTNVENGLGVFSSTYTKVVDGLQLSDFSLDSLACGQITRSLNFADSHWEFGCE